jgi:NDP-hexose 4,6-dehydratase
MTNRSVHSVLVTGAGGFMGSHLTERLLDDGAKVTAVVRRTSQQTPRPLPVNLAGRTDEGLAYLALDLAGPSAVDQLNAQDAKMWFHLAADAYVPASFSQPSAVVTNNVMSTVNLLQAALVAQPDLVVVVSSSEVYGHNDDPISEQSPLRPTTPYAASKLAAEQLAMSYQRSFSLPVVVVRPFNCYGPRHRYDVIPLFISGALRGEPLIVNGDGDQTRDFTYVSDTVQALVRIAQLAEPGEVFNVGTGQDTSVLRVAQLVRELSGSSSDIRHVERRLGEVQRMCSNPRAVTEATGWRAEVSLEEGLRRTIDVARAAR